MNDVISILRKAGIWLWNQKEKTVLIALLFVLCYRVWVVVNPPEQGSVTTGGPEPPPRALPAAQPPERPLAERAEDYRPLVRANPFTIYGVVQDTKGTGDGTPSIDARLIQILKWHDGWRAEIVTQGRPKRYQVGEKFQTYQLLSIDPDNNSVVIDAEQLGRQIELKAEKPTKTN